MTIIGLILKILLGILVTVLLVVGVGIIIILFCPIAYDVKCQKYTAIQAEVVTRVFCVLSIYYMYVGDDSFIHIKLCGKTIKEMQLTPEEEEEIEEEIEGKAQIITNKATKVVAEDVQVLNNPNSTKGQSVTQAKEKRSENKRNSKAKIKKDTKTPKPNKERISDLYDLLKKLWKSPARDHFFKAVLHLIRDIIRSIRPKVFWFDVIIGKDNPAETGELIAKLAIAYPFYAPYGIIQGDYNEAGYWGAIKASGKFNVYQLLKPIVLFGLNKQVREYIKIILNTRKVEKYGV